MSDRLEGWAYPLNQKVNGHYIADHAYVKAPNNGPGYFNCWGGHSGDKEYKVTYGTGDGNYAVADCYRGPEIGGCKDTAYLVYGIDGVCHQAANRFLYSTDQWATVTNFYYGVKGGRASCLLYGVYGLSLGLFFTKYGLCKGEHTINVFEVPTDATVPISGEYNQEFAVLQSQFIDNVLKGNDPNPITQIRSEFDLLVKHSIGDEFVTSKISELHTTLLKDKESITASNVKGEDFAHKINDVLNVFLSQIAEHIGKDHYKTLFDLDPDVPLILVRPEITAVTRK